MPTKPKFRFSNTFWLVVCVVMFLGGRCWHLSQLKSKSTFDARDRLIAEQAETIELLTSELILQRGSTFVVDISDGETVSIVANKQLTRVRMDGIDCPESNQPLGDEAKQFTTDFCMSNEVELNGDERDRSGRRLADVIVDGQSLREALLSAGLAWHDTRTNNDPKLAKLQAEAKAAKRGLWADEDAVPPWEWRE